MTRPEEEEIAAALNAWEQAYRFNELEAAGKELARLLRAANPPVGAERATERADSEQIRRDRGRTFMAEPATPAVGEDEALLERADKFLCDFGSEYCETIVESLASCLRALLADVARLTEERDVEQKRVEDHRENAQFWMNQAERKGATLAAVRKVAENWHVEGVVSDPCAAEILGVLEGNHEPRR